MLPTISEYLNFEVFLSKIVRKKLTNVQQKVNEKRRHMGKVKILLFWPF